MVESSVKAGLGFKKNSPQRAHLTTENKSSVVFVYSCSLPRAITLYSAAPHRQQETCTFAILDFTGGFFTEVLA